MVTVSAKYHQPTFGTSSSFNIATVGPYTHGPPMLDQGFFAPSSNHAVSAWDDPSLFRVKPWHVRLFPHLENVHFAVHLVTTNLQGLWRVLLGFWSLSILVIVLAGIFLLSPKTRSRLVLPCLIALLVFASGYALTVYLDRYLWTLYVIVFMLLAAILEWLAPKVSRLQLVAILVLLLPTFAFLPIKNTYDGQDVDKEFYTYSRSIEPPHLEHARVAADSEWLQSEYLCYYLQCKFYGIPGGLSDTRARAELTAFDVRYVLAWQPIAQKPSYLSDYHLVQLGKSGAPSLYERNNE